MRASSWNQISIGFSLDRWSILTLKTWGKFFERFHDGKILSQMARPGADIGKTKPFQDGRYVVLMADDAKAFFDHALQIKPVPAHYAIALPIQARFDEGLQFGLLRSIQTASLPRAPTVAHAIRAFGVQAVGSVSQCLMVHTALRGPHPSGWTCHGLLPGPEAGARRSHAACAPQLALPLPSSARSSHSKRIKGDDARHSTHEPVAASVGIIPKYPIVCAIISTRVRACPPECCTTS